MRSARYSWTSYFISSETRGAKPGKIVAVPSFTEFIEKFIYYAEKLSALFRHETEQRLVYRLFFNL